MMLDAIYDIGGIGEDIIFCPLDPRIPAETKNRKVLRYKSSAARCSCHASMLRLLDDCYARKAQDVGIW